MVLKIPEGEISGGGRDEIRPFQEAEPSSYPVVEAVGYDP